MTALPRGMFRSIRDRVHATIRRPLARNAVQLVGSRYIAAVARLVTTALAARLLGPEGYGTAALIVAYPSLLSSILGTKSETLTTRYMAVYKAEGKGAELLGICKLGYAMDFIPAVVVALLVVLTSKVFATSAYNRPELAWLMNLYAGALPLVALSNTSAAILTSHRAFRMLAVLQVIQSIINMVAVTGFLLLGLGVTGMILGVMVGQICIGLSLCISAALVLSRDGSGFWWYGKVNSVAPSLREFSHLVGWNYLRDTLRGVLEWMPVMMLGHYRAAEEAAFYRLAANLVNVGRYAETSLNRMIYPIICERTAIAGMQGAKATIRRWTLLGGAPIALALGVGVLLLPAIMPLLFGSDYRDAVLPAQILMTGAALGSIFFWVHPCYYAVGRVGSLTRAFAVYVAVAVAAVWFCIGAYGLIGLVTILVAARLLYLLAMAVGIEWVA